jgi:hypothetical protein
VGLENINSLVDSWTVAWTLVLVLGFVAEFTPWPALRLLKSPRVTMAMLLSSAAVVLGLTLADRTETAAVVTAWAIVMSSVKLLWEIFERE